MRSTELTSSLLAAEVLGSHHHELVYDINSVGRTGKRLMLRFDQKAIASYEETTLGNLMKLIQSYALPTSNLKDSQPIFNAKENRTEIQPLHMRDLRKLDNVFSTSNEASITVRQQTILVNADPIRAIIMRDTCLVFLPDGADSLISLLKQSFKEFIIDTQPVAYEFGALEAILQTLCKFLAHDCEKLLPKAKIAVDRMARDELPLSDLEGFRVLKNAMHELNTQIIGMRQMVMNLLENDDDMHMTYLTKIFNDPGLAKDLQSFDTDTAESLLEVYLHDIYAMQSRVSLMLHNVQNTESVVMLRLDTKRNYLLTVDLTLTLWTATISVSTFITGCFGMNLNSNIQDIDYIFYIVAFVTVLFPIVTVTTIRKKLGNRGISMSLKAK